MTTHVYAQKTWHEVMHHAVSGAPEARSSLAGVLSVREPGIPSSSEGDKA